MNILTTSHSLSPEQADRLKVVFEKAVFDHAYQTNGVLVLPRGLDVLNVNSDDLVWYFAQLGDA